MIKWKQRLYALLLRKVVGPLLDSESQEKLHESIDFSFQEGTFSLANVGLNTTYMNHFVGVQQKLCIRKARVKSIVIRLSLVEEEIPGGAETGSSSSIAWRAMNLGSNKVALVAQIEIDGLQIEIVPLPTTTAAETTAANSDTNSDSDSEATPPKKSTISSYIDAALKSLRLTLNMTNCSFRLSPLQLKDDTNISAARPWLELCLPSLTYKDIDAESPPASVHNPSETTTAPKILHKSVLWQGIAIKAGESRVDDETQELQQDSNLVTTIALAEGTGQILLRAVECSQSNSSRSKSKEPRVQQDVDIRLNQQIKVSLDETSLRQIKCVLDDFGVNRATESDNSEQEMPESVGAEQTDRTENRVDDTSDLYTIKGILKQYEEARLLAARKEMRGGIMVPSNAYEDAGDGEEGDSRTFDLFFDANDKSFSNYASMMKESLLVSKEVGAASDSFVHTKIRVNIMGGGIKFLFRNRTSEAAPYLGPEEYILLTFDELHATSSLSCKRTEFAFHVSHLEIDDSHISHRHINLDAPECRKAEIGSLLSFAQSNDGDLVVNPACISLHLDVDTDASGTKSYELELNLMPIELVYRKRTLSNISSLANTLGKGNSNSKNSRIGDSHGDHSNNPKEQTTTQILSAACTISSLTLTIPALEEHDFSPLYARCGHYSSTCSSMNSSIGFVLEELSFQHKRGSNTTSSEVDNTKSTESCSSLECHNFLVFASSPECTSAPIGRTQRLDIFTATGRFEVEPYIPIALEYRTNNPKEESSSTTSAAKAMFPTVPAFSSFKARQEDEDEDVELDRILSEKLRNVNVDSRTALRARDPQNEMILAAEKSTALLNIHIPEIIFDLSKDELQALLDLLHCCFPPTDNPESTDLSTTSSSPPTPTIAVSVACDSISCSILDKSEGDRYGIDTWNSQLIKFDRCRAHTTVGGGTFQFLRISSHETTLFELIERMPSWSSAQPAQGFRERVANLKIRATTTPSAVAVPLLYRSKIFHAISPGSPSLLLDLIRSRDDEIEDLEGEQSVFISVYDMTYRYDPDSKWINRLLAFGTAFDSNPARNQSGPRDNETSSLTKVFVSLADCNVDYSSLERFNTESRSVIRVGDLRLSSNVLTPSGSLQAYNLSLGDLSWHLCNTRCPYSFENSLLPGAHLIMPPMKVASKQPHANGADYMFSLGFKTVLTLDSLRAVIAKTNAKSTRTKLSGGTSSEPSLTTSLVLGEVSMYACKDSFQCFTNTVGELQTKLTALSNEDLDKLKSKFQERSLDAEGTERGSHGIVSNRKHETIRTETLSIDTNGNYLLDGYDWTTIDHDGGSQILPGEEQAARWYNAPNVATAQSNMGVADSIPSLADSTRSASMNDSCAPRIIDHHFPFHVGETETAQFAGGESRAVESRVLLHDLKVKVRFFDGYDWPQFQRKRKLNPKAPFIIDDPEELETQEEVLKNQGAKTSHLDGLLSGSKDSSDMFSSTPLPEERALTFIAQNEVRMFSRRTNSYIQLAAEGVSVRVDSYRFSVDHRMKSRLHCSLNDFFMAETISSSNPVKMVGEWFNEVQHPRDSRDGLLMLQMTSWDPVVPVTEDGHVANDECEIVATLAPVRCNIDQRAIMFAKKFFAPDVKKDDSVTAQDWSAGLNLIPPPRFRAFCVKPIRLKLNYSPQKLDTGALRNGSIVELINLSPLDDLVLTLQEVEVINVVGFGEAIGDLVSHWLGDICNTQMHKFLTNARPFEPFTNVSGGVADLFLLPWDAYQNGESVSRALRSAGSSFAGIVAHETLTQSSRLTGFIADSAGKATSSSHSAGSKSHNSLPSRPLQTPRRMSDTAGHAIESLTRGVQTASYKVIIVPYHEYRRCGTRGLVKSFVRGIPVAVAAPVGGVSESVSYALLGLRNQLRQDLRQEEEASKRGLHYGN